MNKISEKKSFLLKQYKTFNVNTAKQITATPFFWNCHNIITFYRKLFKILKQFSP